MCSFWVPGITWAHTPCSSLLASVGPRGWTPHSGPWSSTALPIWLLPDLEAKPGNLEMVPDSQSYWLGDLSKLPKPSHLYILIRKRGTTALPHLTMGKTEP